jgi:hypothetical protein
MQYCGSIPTFKRFMLSPSSGLSDFSLKMEAARSSEILYGTTTLHGITTVKNLGLLKFSYINHKSHGSKYFDFAKRNLNI